MVVIANATVSTGNGNDTQRVHLVVEGEAIREIRPATRAVPRASEVISADGLLVLPGAIDPHVHFDTPGFTEREDFLHGSLSAAAGGVTTVIDMPCTSLPPVTDRASLVNKLKTIGEMPVVDFALWGGVSGNTLRSQGWRSHLRQLKLEGCVGIKCYLVSGMRTFESVFPLELVEIMRRVHELGMVLGIHAEDRDLIQSRTAAMQVTGRHDARAYYESRSDPAEFEGVKQAVALAEETGCSIHVVHVGSGKAAELILDARRRGAPVTMETCPHYLAFSCENFFEQGSILKVAPTIKTREDQAVLWKHIIDGHIDFLASDHAPAPAKDKATGSIWTDYSGISGTELLFPYAFSEGYAKGKISLARLIELSSSNAARRYGLYPRKGAIAIDTDADLIFVDPKATWTVQGERFGSKGKQTPFEGVSVTGKVVRTMCRGMTIHTADAGITVQPGFGRFIRRGA